MTRTQGQRRPDEPQGTAVHHMTLRIDKPLVNRLNIAALATEQSSSDIVRAALRSWLDHLESAPEHQHAYSVLREALGIKGEEQ